MWAGRLAGRCTAADDAPCMTSAVRPTAQLQLFCNCAYEHCPIVRLVAVRCRGLPGGGAGHPSRHHHAGQLIACWCFGARSHPPPSSHAAAAAAGLFPQQLHLPPTLVCPSLLFSPQIETAVAYTETQPAAGGPLHAGQQAADSALHHNSFVEPHPEAAGASAAPTAAAPAAGEGGMDAQTAALLQDPVVREVRSLLQGLLQLDLCSICVGAWAFGGRAACSVQRVLAQPLLLGTTGLTCMLNSYPLPLQVLSFWSYYRGCGYEADAMAQWVGQVRGGSGNAHTGNWRAGGRTNGSMPGEACRKLLDTAACCTQALVRVPGLCATLVRIHCCLPFGATI